MLGLLGGFAKTAGLIEYDNEDENDLTSPSMLSSLSYLEDSIPSISQQVTESKSISEAETETDFVTKKYKNGETYEGPMVDDMRHGDGAVSFRSDGSKFVGSYHRDKPSQGTLITTTYTYVGGLRNERFQGAGTLVYSSGETYHGDFENGLRHGVGKATTLVNEEDIEIINKMRATQPKISPPTERTYVTFSGDFYYGKRHGMGKLVDVESGILLFSGLYINGRKALFKDNNSDQNNKVKQEAAKNKKFSANKTL